MTPSSPHDWSHDYQPAITTTAHSSEFIFYCHTSPFLMVPAVLVVGFVDGQNTAQLTS